MIAPATAAHAPALAAIHAACFTGPDAWDAPAWASLLATPGTHALLHPPGGVILLRQAADQADIVTLAVAPEARRRGIARALLTQALRELHANQVISVYLEVSPSNTAARALYDQAGFIHAAIRRAYYADGGDALLLRLALTASPPAAAACHPPA